MPSRRHELLAWAVPRVRGSRELDTEERERRRLESWHRDLDRSLPTRLVPAFSRRFAHSTEDADGVPVHLVTPRRPRGGPDRTIVYLHGGGFVAPVDPFHVRYACGLATALGARVVLPDYPLAPEHTWRDSFEALVGTTARWARDGGRLTLAGDSAGGGLALAVAMALRDRDLPSPAELLLLAPWVDLTTSTPETASYDALDPWLFLGKLQTYARWWAGSPEDLGRPEVSPGLGDLAGLPRALMFCGTRDLLLPGCRLLARRAAEAGWDLHYVERTGLLHVFPLLPLVPEARAARRTTREFLA